MHGIHAVRLLLERAPERVLHLHILESAAGANSRLATVLAEARRFDIPVTRATREQLARLAEGGVHQGLVADIRPARVVDESALPELLDRLTGPPLLLVLDGVQDPHNLGACLRTADAAGVNAVIIPRHRAAGLTPVVHKTACGATQTLPLVQATNLARALRNLKDQGIWLLGAAGDARDSLYSANLTGPLAIVVGAEQEGLRRLTRDLCDTLVHIPMRGAVESLNVSVATGVCLFEARRQQASDKGVRAL
ncbi:MAG TPA: 23S rRNA (guanosine(2251)-2'-O)-methyltransferase RlmB [Gammaproteobacteria bacterium]|nr:23S rRNA (guanosine(2251)-2'-O)-methyltransferase RlmB [Gammaproteobacteria bacterium]